jgi:hypothetical protein
VVKCHFPGLIRSVLGNAGQQACPDTAPPLQHYIIHVFWHCFASHIFILMKVHRWIRSHSHQSMDPMTCPQSHFWYFGKLSLSYTPKGISEKSLHHWAHQSENHQIGKINFKNPGGFNSTVKRLNMHQQGTDGKSYAYALKAIFGILVDCLSHTPRRAFQRKVCITERHATPQQPQRVQRHPLNTETITERKLGKCRVIVTGKCNSIEQNPNKACASTA